MFRPLLAFCMVVMLGATSAHALVQRAYVSALTGNDANTATDCQASAPCRWFAGAISVVASGGEIVAMDTGAYGTVTITKSIAIVGAPGAYAGITVFAGNGITIATAGVNVVLRGLTLNGLGGTHGVNMSDGTSLSVENCVIANFSSYGGHGVFVNAPAKLRVVHSLFRNDFHGVSVSNGATASISESKFFGNSYAVWVNDYYGGDAVTTAFVDRSVATGGGYGFLASNEEAGRVSRIYVTDSVASDNSDTGIFSTVTAGTAEATATNNRVFRNAYGLGVLGSGAKLIATGNTVSKNVYGLRQATSGVLESAGDNVVRDNTTNVSGSIATTFGKM